VEETFLAAAAAAIVIIIIINYNWVFTQWQ
jgi:hypothetical protein